MTRSHATRPRGSIERRTALRPWLATMLLVAAFAGPVLHAALLHLHQARFHRGAQSISPPPRPTALQNLRALTHHPSDLADHAVDAAHDGAPAARWIHVDGPGGAPTDPAVNSDAGHVHGPNGHQHEHEFASRQLHDSDTGDADPAQPHRHGDWTHSHGDSGDDSLGELAASLLKIFAARAGPELPTERETRQASSEPALHLPVPPRALEIPPPRSISV